MNITGSSSGIYQGLVQQNEINHAAAALGSVIGCHNKDPKVDKIARDFIKIYKFAQSYQKNVLFPNVYDCEWFKEFD